MTRIEELARKLNQEILALEVVQEYQKYEKLVLNDKDEEKEDANLVFSYIYYIFHNDYEQYYAVVLKVLRGVINNMLTFANHDLDLALGNSFPVISAFLAN